MTNADADCCNRNQDSKNLCKVRIFVKADFLLEAASCNFRIYTCLRHEIKLSYKAAHPPLLPTIISKRKHGIKSDLND